MKDLLKNRWFWGIIILVIIAGIIGCKYGLFDSIKMARGGQTYRVPFGRKMCDCKYGQHQTISFWQWAFGGGCGGISVGGSPCFPS